MATVKRHHLVVRVTHWVNALALTIMIGSGLRIFNAYPAFARKGESFCCYPFAGKKIPVWLTFGGWLEGARHWHFGAMWLLAVNGLVYLAFIYLHGEWRDLVPRRGVARDSWEMLKFYLALRPEHPRQGKHNAFQRTVYFTMPWLGVVAVLSGLAIWKPVQLAPLANLFGGFVWARYIHFLVMLALVVLSAGHVFMVFAVDPYALRSIVTGRYNEERSPELRNARPFVNLRVRPHVEARAPAAPPPMPEDAAVEMPAPPPTPEGAAAEARAPAPTPEDTVAEARPSEPEPPPPTTPPEPPKKS
jgi:thiosulfate reductase cytochrome b subunit